MRFLLEITLGNDAMETYGDAAEALRKVADDISVAEDIDRKISDDKDGASICDSNGNRVGEWRVVKR